LNFLQYIFLGFSKVTYNNNIEYEEKVKRGGIVEMWKEKIKTPQRALNNSSI